jgi:inosine-uridine nucleoside N-ribohydrolase
LALVEKVLFDTDIGSDIDDAVALAYLLAQPDCELLGITTVSGGSERRAAMASAMCRVAGADVPIFPGSSGPLLGEQRQPYVPQADRLGSWPHQDRFPVGEAIAFLSQTIRAHPGEVTLLAVGPMTNLALLFRSDPEAAGLLKRLVLMCGVFTNRLAGVGPLEWNARCDAHATAIVYSAGAGVHRSCGLDVTCRVRMPAEEVRSRFTAELLAPVLDFAEVWFERRQQITFHDPLAAVSLFEDDVVDFGRGTVRVETTSAHSNGRTVFEAGDGPHEVGLDVDAARFFERYFQAF